MMMICSTYVLITAEGKSRNEKCSHMKKIKRKGTKMAESEIHEEHNSSPYGTE